MAFLSTSQRFGPDLDKIRKLQPNPATYEPVNPTLASGTPFRTTSRYGTIGPHYYVALQQKAAASPAALTLSSVDVLPSSPTSLRYKVPTSWHYTPTQQGQFPRVYTVRDLEEKRKERIKSAKMSEVSRKLKSQNKPEEVQHLALGPGTYDVDKDWDLEAISIPFSFGKDRRRGILECSVGEQDLRSYHRRMERYSKKLSADQRSRSETALLPLRRASSHLTDEVAELSRELGKSYEYLKQSASRLERKLSSPAARSEKFERFLDSRHDREAFRRGPGSYFADKNPKTLETNTTVVSPSLPLDDQQRQELEALLVKSSASVQHVYTKKKATTFGLVKHRDMLTSMKSAGHLSAIAVEAEIGPGLYEPSASMFGTASHNVRYKRKPRQKPQQKGPSCGDSEELGQQWRKMRRGPNISESNDN